MSEKLPSTMSTGSAPKCNCKSVRSEKSGSNDNKSTSTSSCCMKKRFWSMLSNKFFSDVCFIVGPEMQRVDAHKAVLSASSSVFEAMFNKNWSAESKDIEIPDIEPEAFSSLLSFLYTDEVELTGDSVLKVLYIAKKYAVHALEDQCSAFLEEQLSPENACSLLMEAELFDQQELIESCLEVIDWSPEDALMSNGFLSIDLKALRRILERDTLTMDEVALFDAVVRWSVAECQRKSLVVNGDNQKSVLEGTVSLVRFPLMTSHEFASSVLPFNLLSKDEALDVFRYFSGVPNSPSGVITTPRSLKEPFIVDRFREAFRGDSSNSRTDGIGFSFDCDVRLLGFILYTSCDGKKAKYNIDIIIKNNETGTILYQDSSSYEGADEGYIHNFTLKKSIKLTASTLYGVVTKIKGPDAVYGEGGKESYVIKDSKTGKELTIKFKNIDYEDPEKRTDVSQGQFPKILFTW